MPDIRKLEAGLRVPVLVAVCNGLAGSRLDIEFWVGLNGIVGDELLGRGYAKVWSPLEAFTCALAVSMPEDEVMVCMLELVAAEAACIACRL
jgi:hypothetical protein